MDGGAYSSSGTLGRWGPTFTTDDVIGCCIDFRKRIIFYTKNGDILDAAFRDLAFQPSDKPAKEEIYPMIEMSHVRQVVHLNFGKEEFLFDIAHYARGEEKLNEV